MIDGGLIVSKFWKLLISLLKRAGRHPISSRVYYVSEIFFSVYLAFKALIPNPFSFVLVSICLTFVLYPARNIGSPSPFIRYSPHLTLLPHFHLSPLSPLSLLQGTSFFLNFFAALPILIDYSAAASRLGFSTIPWASLPRTKHYQGKSLYVSLRPPDTRCSSVIWFMTVGPEACSETSVSNYYSTLHNDPIATEISFVTWRNLEIIHEACFAIS